MNVFTPKFQVTINSLIIVFSTLITITTISFVWWNSNRPIPNVQHISHLGGNFTLNSQAGAVSLSDYEDKVVLIYFGYTNCMDACPTTLSNWANALSTLNKTEREKVHGLLISVDIERDSLGVLAEYTQYFHQQITGLTGSAEQIDQVTQKYRVDYEIYEANDTTTDEFSIDHSTYVYIVNPKGDVQEIVSYDSSSSELVKEIRKLL